MIGEKFGRLTVLSLSHTSKGYRHYLCKCECGASHTVQGTSLRSGNTKSCGCLARDNGRRQGSLAKTHGMSGSRVYGVYKAMLARCSNPGVASFQYYGAKGVKVCLRWTDSFENFYADMGPCPEGFSIDRIDSNGNYEPSNCRWVTNQMQSQNRDYVKKHECVHGHLLTDDNVYLGSRGQKNCKICAKERASAYKKKIKALRTT
jgi:hypothetical protein